MLDSYYSSVGATDHLWVLGDLSASSTGEALALGYIALLKEATGAQVHLIVGNHDRCSPIHRDSHKHQARFMEVFDSVQAFARRRGPDRVPVLLSHYPYEAAGDGPHREGSRYGQYRLPDRGEWLLHGHTHQPEFRSGPRSLHVGWDAHRKPVPWSTIEQIIEKETSR